MQENNNDTNKAYEKVIVYIKNQIVTGALQQGENLPPERDLAKELGVSRNSVREALRTLAVIGIITSTQGAGNTISCNFEKSLINTMSMMMLMQKISYQQLNELRCGLEEQAIALCINKITFEEIALLEKIVQELQESQSQSLSASLDKKLHDTIATASGNQLIIAILQVLSGVMERAISEARIRISSKVLETTELQNIHARIVAEIKNNNKEKAQAALWDHYEFLRKHHFVF